MRCQTYIYHGRVVIENTVTGWVDYPIMYADGRMAYDAPERIPQYAKRAARRLLIAQQEATQ